jgi:hypothetical protein
MRVVAPARRMAHPKLNHVRAGSGERESGGQNCWTIDPGVRDGRPGEGYCEPEGSIATHEFNRVAQYGLCQRRKEEEIRSWTDRWKDKRASCDKGEQCEQHD